MDKPLGKKAYGSIGHLPNSRRGPGDHSVHEGQARICTEKARDKNDRIVVQEKLDGSCCAVVRLEDNLIPLGRAGWPAITSKWEMHTMFHDWAWERADLFFSLLSHGERVVGEWLAQAHGTLYDLSKHEPFAVFDIMTGDKRVDSSTLLCRVGGLFETPNTLHVGGPISTLTAMALHKEKHWPCDNIEGVVYRVERQQKDGHWEVDFLAKYVRPGKVDGIYIGDDAVPRWNWKPEKKKHTL